MIPGWMCAAGMGHYKALRGGLDMLVANDQLELLLGRRSASQSSTGMTPWTACNALSPNGSCAEAEVARPLPQAAGLTKSRHVLPSAPLKQAAVGFVGAVPPDVRHWLHTQERACGERPCWRPSRGSAPMTRRPGSLLTSILAVLGRQPPACSSVLRYGPPLYSCRGHIQALLAEALSQMATSKRLTRSLRLVSFRPYTSLDTV